MVDFNRNNMTDPGERPTRPLPRTLRDEFAMAALGGLLANSGFADPAHTYRLADTMLAAREQK